MRIKTSLLLSALLIFAITVLAQKEIPLFTISTKKSTRPAPTGIISAYELKVMKAVPGNVFKTVDDGIAIVAGDEFYKYNADFGQVFKADLTKLWKFSVLNAYTNVVSDDKATYILEVKRKSKERASVIHITPNGEAKQLSYEIDINDNMEFESFIANGKLCVLGKDIDKKKGSVNYKYYYISSADDKLASATINLPSNDYEFEKIKKEDSGSYYWRYLSNNGDNAILVKAYFKKIPGSKKSSFVCDLVEVDMQGNISANKSISFEPKLAGDDREFVDPYIVFNKADHSVYFAGFMEIDSHKINGLYLLKYDYTSAQLTYNKEFAFDELLKPEIKKNTDVHYSIPEKVSQFYPLKIRSDDVFIDNVNNFINLRIITDYGFDKTTFFEVAFDKYGDHISTAVTNFSSFINYYGSYLPNSSGYQQVWADKTRPHVTGAKSDPLSYIFKRPVEKKSDLFWIPVSTPKINSVIKYNSDTKSFAVILLK